MEYLDIEDFESNIKMEFNNSNNSIFENSSMEIFDERSEKMYLSSFGVWLAIPEWEASITALILSLIIILTLVGNVLVILSVFTYRPLRSAPNFYVVSLAVADMTVAILVLPFNVVYLILGRWVLGKILCEFWLTCDIYCCTNSILHLCVIAVDRYRAITDPINYARKRTLQRVFCTIATVWITSFIISSPPLLGWNDWPPEFNDDTPCTLTSEQGYVIYSSLGSFFLPLILMTSVYIRIYIATRRRLRQRARASRLSAMARQKSIDPVSSSKNIEEETAHGEREGSSISSVEYEGVAGTVESEHCKSRKKISGTKSSITKRNKKQQGSTSTNTNRKKIKGAKSSTIETELCNTSRPSISLSGSRKGKDTGGSEHASSLQAHQYPMNESDNSNLSPSNITSIADTQLPLSSTKQIINNSTTRQYKNTSNSTRTLNRKSPRIQSQQVSQFVEEKQRISLSKERKAARTLGIIMGVFVVCWLPFFLMYVILPFCTICVQPSSKLVNFITWLGYVNSALNPIIYTIFNMDFRKAFKKLLHLDN